jgi:hypothetical protein
LVGRCREHIAETHDHLAPRAVGEAHAHS